MNNPQVWFFEPLVVDFFVTVDKFQAVIDLLFEFNVEKDYQQKLGKIEHELLRIPVPGVSLQIPKIATVGLFVPFMFYGEIQTFGRISFNVGMTSHIPKGARLTMHLFPPKAEATGFDGGGLDFFFKPKSGSAEGNLLFFPGVGLNFGASILDSKDKFEIQNTLRVPSMTVGLYAGYSEQFIIPHG
jgi:hypothetical protein